MFKKGLAILLALCLTVLSCTSVLAADESVTKSTSVQSGDVDDASGDLVEDERYDIVAAKSGTTITAASSFGSVTALDGRVYIMEESRLLSYTPGAASPETVKTYTRAYHTKETLAQLTAEALEEEKRMPSLIGTDGETLYGLSTTTGYFGPIVDGLITDGVQLDWDEVYTQNGTRTMKSMVISGGYMFTTLGPSDVTSYSSTDMQVYRFDLTTGDMKETSLIGSYELTPYKDGKLLVYEQFSYRADGGIGVYNPQTDVIEEIVVPIKGSDAGAQGISHEGGGIAYDAQTDSIYFVDSGAIFSWLAGGTAEQRALASANFLFGVIYAGVVDESYVFCTWTELYIRSLKAEDQPERVLRISGGYETDAVAAYRRENPDAAIMFDSSSYYSGAEAVQTDMLTGATANDIYAMDLMSGASTLIEKGYVQDLSASDILTDNVKRMYPQLAEALMHDGKVYAFPYSFGFSAWNWNKTAWDSFDMGEMPTTMLELVEALQLWLDDYADDNPDYTLLDLGEDKSQLFGIALQQYIAQYDKGDGSLTFDTPAFRETMQAIEDLDIAMPEQEEDNGAASRGVSVVYYTGADDSEHVTTILDPNIYEPIAARSSWEGNVEDEFVLTPPLPFEAGDEPVTSANMTLYLVNPNSPNVDLAIDFLEYVAQHNDPGVDYMIHPDLKEPMRRSYYEQNMKENQAFVDEQKKLMEASTDDEEKKSLQDNIEAIEAYMETMKDDWHMSPESIAKYRAIAPTMSVFTDSQLMNGGGAGMAVIQEVFMRYFGGQVTLDNLIRELDQKLNMIYLEGK